MTNTDYETAKALSVIRKALWDEGILDEHQRRELFDITNELARGHEPCEQFDCSTEATQKVTHDLGGESFVCDDHAEPFPAEMREPIEQPQIGT